MPVSVAKERTTASGTLVPVKLPVASTFIGVVIVSPSTSTCTMLEFFDGGKEVGIGVGGGKQRVVAHQLGRGKRQGQVVLGLAGIAPA